MEQLRLGRAPDPLDPDNEVDLYKSKGEALRQDVFPRSNPSTPAPAQPKGQTFEFDLFGSSPAPASRPAPAKSNTFEFDLFSDRRAASATQPEPKEPGLDLGGSFAKGVKGLKVTWDFLASKLEKAVTGDAKDTGQILANSAKEYEAMASDPRIAEMVKMGDDAPNTAVAVRDMLGFALRNPTMVANFIAEQAPGMIGGGGAGMAISAPIRGLVQGTAKGAALKAGTQALINTGTAGAAINAGATTFQSLGSNYVDGLRKYSGDTEAASEYAITKTAAEVPTNAIAGAFLGFAPFASKLANVGLQTAIQGTGGAAGAGLASLAVGEDPSRGEMILEFLGEAVSAPLDMLQAKFGGTTTDETKKIVDDKMKSEEGRQEVVDALATEERMRERLSGIGLIPPTPDEVAQRTKERGEDVRAAFGESASTSIGVGAGDNAPVVQRQTVTVDTENKTIEGGEPVRLQTVDGATNAVSGEDMVSNQQGWTIVPAFKVGESTVNNSFVSLPQAETFLFGPINKETGKREGGFASTVVGQEFQVRQGKRSKQAGGGTFYFVEARPSDEKLAVQPAPVQTEPAIQQSVPKPASVVTPPAPATTRLTAAALSVTPPLTDVQQNQTQEAPKTQDQQAQKKPKQTKQEKAEQASAMRQAAVETWEDNDDGKNPHIPFNELSRDDQELWLEVFTESGGRLPGDQAISLHDDIVKKVRQQQREKNLTAQRKATRKELDEKAALIADQDARAEAKAREDRRLAREARTDMQTFPGVEPKGEQAGKRADPPTDNDIDEAPDVTLSRRDFSYGTITSIDDLNRLGDKAAKRNGMASWRSRRVKESEAISRLPGVPQIIQMAKVFKKNVVFFEVEPGSPDFFNGAVLPGSGTIFININSNRSHIRIFGHELVHALRNTQPDVYRKLLNALRPMFSEQGMDDYFNKQMGWGLKNFDKILEEAVGDLVGDRFGERAFWEMLSNENPTLFQQLADFITRFIDKTIAMLRNDKTLGSERLVDDLQSARQVIAKVLGEPVVETDARQTDVQQEAIAASRKDAVDDIAFSRRDDEGFYSALERAFEQVKMESMPPDQWSSWLNSNQSKLRITKAEIEWTGIMDWLDLKNSEGTKRINRQEVLSFIAGNKLRLNDVLLEGPGKYLSDADVRELYAAHYGFLEWEVPSELTREDMLYDIGMYEAMASGTKHGTDRRLVLPGGKKQFELVVTEPSPRTLPYNQDDVIHFGDVSGGKAIGWIRGNVRKDVSGNHVLFLEEIQSQRGQDGASLGFARNEGRKEKEAAINKLLDERLNLRDGINELTNRLTKSDVLSIKERTSLTEQREKLYTRQSEIDSEIADLEFEGVPPAPFVKDTKSWTALLLKKAIAYSQEKGIDRIAWTTGQQQTERYKLSKSIDDLRVTKNSDGSFNVVGKKDGDTVVTKSAVKAKSLSNVIGKDLAELAIEQDGISLSGEEMDVGGHGLSDYYNKMVGSVADKILKEFGGKVEVMELDGTGKQLGFVITPKLQAQVAEDGLPMFSRKDYESQFSDLPESVQEMAVRKGHYSPPTIRERLESLKPQLWTRVVQGTFDRFRRVRDIDMKAYMALRMSSSTDGAVEGLLHFGQVFDDGGALNLKKGTKGLLEILKPVGVETDRFLLWIAANRAGQLSAQEREKFFTPEEIRELKRLNVGTTKDGKSRPAVYAETLRQMNELNKSVLDVALQTGLIDKKAFDKFSSDIWYIPFYRQMEDDKTLSAAQNSSSSVGQYLSKQLKGSDRQLNDLMQNVLLNWSHILSASMKNKAAVDTLQAALQMGDVVTRLDRAEKGAVKVMEKGKESYFRIDDELLLAALDGVATMPSYSPFTVVAREFKTALTRFVSLSPTFKINNLIRDSVQSIGLTELKPNPISNVIQGWRAYTDDRAEALIGGGLFAMGNAYDGDRAAHVKRLIKMGVAEADIVNTPAKWKAWLSKVGEKYDQISDAAENANRLALYNQLREKGASHLEAAYAARDLQDFSLQGSWAAIRWASQVLPYFNARLQGMYKLGRDGFDPALAYAMGNADALQRQKAAKFAAVAGAVTAVGVGLLLAYKDDEDWKKREDWDRDGFFWAKFGEFTIRIPKPFEMGALSSIVERMTEQAVDSSIEGKVFGKRVAAILADNLAINPIPQIIRPLYDIARNKDGFTDRPIESMGDERLSPENRKRSGTSAAAVGLGNLNSMFAEMASAATGGAVTANNMKLSPIQYDYMIRNYLGWVGTVIQTTSNLAVTPFKKGETPEMKVDDLLVVGNFVKQLPQNQSRYVTSFYENAKEIATATSDFRSFLSAGKIDEAMSVLESKRDMIALSKLYTNISDRMSTIQKRADLTSRDETMDGEQKRLEMDRLAQLRIELAKRAEEIRISRSKDR